MKKRQMENVVTTQTRRMQLSYKESPVLAAGILTCLNDNGACSLSEMMNKLPDGSSKKAVKNGILRLIGKRYIVKDFHDYSITERGSAYLIALLPPEVVTVKAAMADKADFSANESTSFEEIIERDLTSKIRISGQKSSISETKSHQLAKSAVQLMTKSHQLARLLDLSHETHEENITVDSPLSSTLENNRPWPYQSAMRFSCNHLICKSNKFPSPPVSLMVWKEDASPSSDEFTLVAFLVTNYKAGKRQWKYQTEDDLARDSGINTFNLKQVVYKLENHDIIWKRWGKDEKGGGRRIGVKPEFIMLLHSAWHKALDEETDAEIRQALIDQASWSTNSFSSLHVERN